MKRKRLNVAVEGKDEMQKNSTDTLAVHYVKKIKSDVVVTFEDRENAKLVLTTVKEKKDDKLDDTVDISICRACNVIITNSKDAIEKMKNDLAERNFLMTGGIMLPDDRERAFE